MSKDQREIFRHEYKHGIRGCGTGDDVPRFLLSMSPWVCGVGWMSPCSRTQQRCDEDPFPFPCAYGFSILLSHSQIGVVWWCSPFNVVAFQYPEEPYDDDNHQNNQTNKPLPSPSQRTIGKNNQEKFHPGEHEGRVHNKATTRTAAGR